MRQWIFVLMAGLTACALPAREAPVPLLGIAQVKGEYILCDVCPKPSIKHVDTAEESVVSLTWPQSATKPKDIKKNKKVKKSGNKKLKKYRKPKRPEYICKKVK